MIVLVDGSTGCDYSASWIAHVAQSSSVITCFLCINTSTQNALNFRAAAVQYIETKHTKVSQYYNMMLWCSLVSQHCLYLALVHNYPVPKPKCL